MDRRAGSAQGGIVKDTRISVGHEVHVIFRFADEGAAAGTVRVAGQLVLDIEGEPLMVKRALADALQRLAFNVSKPAIAGGHRVG